MHSIPLLVVFVVGAAAPVQAETPDDTNTQMSLGYEYRRLIKERLRGFGDLIYEERYDSDFFRASQAALSTTGGVGLYYAYRADLSDTFEYRLAFAIPLNRYTVEPRAFYLPLKAEFFVTDLAGGESWQGPRLAPAAYVHASWI